MLLTQTEGCRFFCWGPAARFNLLPTYRQHSTAQHTAHERGNGLLAFSSFNISSSLVGLIQNLVLVCFLFSYISCRGRKKKSRFFSHSHGFSFQVLIRGSRGSVHSFSERACGPFSYHAVSCRWKAPHPGQDWRGTRPDRPSRGHCLYCCHEFHEDRSQDSMRRAVRPH